VMKKKSGRSHECGRFYKTIFETNKKRNVIAVFAVSSEKNEVLSVDSGGGVHRLNVDNNLSDYLDLIQDDSLEVACAAFDTANNKVYLGMQSGAVWTSDFVISEGLPYTHQRRVTSLVVSSSFLFSAGMDSIIKMFSIESVDVVASIKGYEDISAMHILPVAHNLHVLLSDTVGSVSVWSPNSKTSVASVQHCCNLHEPILGICSIHLFEKICPVFTTANSVRVWSITERSAVTEMLSILKDSTYSLVRSLKSPPNTKFTSCVDMSCVAPALLTGCSDGCLYQWDPLSGLQMRKFEVSTGSNIFLRYMLPKNLIVSCDMLNTVSVINPFSSPLVDYVTYDARPEITCAAVCDIQGMVLISGDRKGMLRIRTGISASTESEKQFLAKEMSAVIIVPLECTSEVLIVMGYVGGFLRSCVVPDDLNLDKAVEGKHTGCKGRITVLRYLGRDSIATASEGEDVIIWKFSPMKLTEICRIPDSVGVTCMCCAPQGLLVCGTNDGRIVLWDCESNTCVGMKYNAHTNGGVFSVGVLYDSDRITQYILSSERDTSSVKLWKHQASELILEGKEDHSPCTNITFWPYGESRLMFVKAADGVLIAKYVRGSGDHVLRYFTPKASVASTLLAVSGMNSPLVLTISEDRAICVWNNDLHDEQSKHSSMMSEFYKCVTSSLLDCSTFYSVIRKHSSFPGCLIVPDATHDSQTVFAQALLHRRFNIMRSYLSRIPVAVAQLFTHKKKVQSLLSIALSIDDSDAVECILEAWRVLLTASPENLESSAWHVGELFRDLKLLSRKRPAKFVDFIAQLSIPKGHPINTDGTQTRRIKEDELWMRGSSERVIPGLWLYVKKQAYPDLVSREYGFEEEKELQKIEMPHLFEEMQEPLTKGIVNTMRKPHPSVGESSIDYKYAIANGDDAEADAVNGPFCSTLDVSGTRVESYVHPIPYAAAGVEFLKICQRCALLSGNYSLMSSPAVATVIDFKWNSYFGDKYRGAVVHYICLLLLYTVYCVYFDAVMETPLKTGLPMLGWIVTLFLIFNYFVLLVQLLLRLGMSNSYLCITDPWLYNGVAAYSLAICGLSMNISKGEEHSSSSFHSRCVLCVSTVLLYAQFLWFLMPLKHLGPIIHRIFLTLRVTRYHFFLIAVGICSFAVAFNLMHHRQSDEVTYDSLYGSFLQTLIYMFGGFSSEFGEFADNTLFMSVFFVAFVVTMIWVSALMLLAATVEEYGKTQVRAENEHRMTQARIIISASMLMNNATEKLFFHNPKWLHILAPVGHMESVLKCDSADFAIDDSTLEVSNACTCTLTEINRLKDMIYQLHDRIDVVTRRGIDEASLVKSLSDTLRRLMEENAEQSKSRVQKSEDVKEQVIAPVEPLKVDKIEVSSQKPEKRLDRPRPACSPESSTRVRSIKASKKNYSLKILNK